MMSTFVLYYSGCFSVNFSNFQCENYELSVLDQRRQSINQGWFGGQAMAVVGECHCQRMHQFWDKQELQCSVADYFLKVEKTLFIFQFIGYEVHVSGWLISNVPRSSTEPTKQDEILHMFYVKTLYIHN